jgi:dCTP deaminase
MSFWTTETFRSRLHAEAIVTPADESRIKQGCYQLSVGREACITNQHDETQKTILESADNTAIIPPGQFALLMTDEVVRIPANTIGFISIRFSYKAKGLINVSGFHVDPGFAGRLKFSVYNAGSQSVAIQRGDQLFMLWIANLDRETQDHYKGEHQGQDGISATDIERMQGVLYSPASLIDRIKQLEKSTDSRMQTIESRLLVASVIFKSVLAMLVVPLLWIFVKPAFEKWMEEDGRTIAPRPAVDNTIGPQKDEANAPTPISDKRK